ncbi:tyrosine-type recombinase/integrase [Weissella confusa]|uniref:tyrosine-type recombinase/integrase n=1 Tax=Weissella confusa TaxID=1583 RepID=UPI003D7C875D
MDIEAKDWIPTHGLRHTLVSVLIGKGIPIQYVSQVVGHASVSITQDTYQHLLHETKIATDEAVGKLLDAL